MIPLWFSIVDFSLTFLSPAVEHSGVMDEGEPMADATRGDSAVIGGD